MCFLVLIFLSFPLVSFLRLIIFFRRFYDRRDRLWGLAISQINADMVMNADLKLLKRLTKELRYFFIFFPLQIIGLNLFFSFVYLLFLTNDNKS